MIIVDMSVLRKIIAAVVHAEKWQHVLVLPERFN